MPNYGMCECSGTFLSEGDNIRCDAMLHPIAYFALTPGLEAQWEERQKELNQIKSAQAEKGREND